jgi:hypothetical protein
MTAACAFVLILSMAVGGAADPGAQSRPGDAPEVKTGTIRGRVTATDTGKPLRRARVTIASAQGAATSRPLVANTNASGQFEVTALSPGSYYVSAGRAGYLTIEHGQRRAGERGLAIEVRSGQVAAGIDLALPRAGVMAGRITDERGDPYPGVLVDALAMRYSRGRREPSPVAGATTDDLGQFRLAGLPPGRYYVVATSTETWRTDKKEIFGYAPTYYPGVAFDAAQIVTLGASEQRMDLNFSLQSSRTARISGRVQRESGEAMAGASVQLAYSYPGVIVTAGMRVVRTAGDGTFEIKDVPPGTYSVGGGSAEQIVTVAAADIDDVVLVPKTGSTVSGTLVTDTGTMPPFPASGVRVFLEAPYGKVLPTVRVVPVDADWSFKLTNLGGPFVFRVGGIPDDWALASVQLGEKAITDVPWDVPTGGKEISGMRIVISQKIGMVTGQVVDDTGNPSSAATVIVFSDDADLWFPGSRAVRAARPSADGSFRFVGLPSGTYHAIARDFVENGQWEDRTFLEGLREGATKVVLGDGGSQAITLNLPRPK